MSASMPLWLLPGATDPIPADNDVVAGWVGAVVFVVLIIAVVLICRSLVTRLRNVDRAESEGRYDPSDKKPLHQKVGDPDA